MLYRAGSLSSLEIRVPPHWLITGLPIVEAIALFAPKLSFLQQHCQCLPVPACLPARLAARLCLRYLPFPAGTDDQPFSSCMCMIAQGGQGRAWQGQGQGVSKYFVPT